MTILDLRKELKEVYKGEINKLNTKNDLIRNYVEIKTKDNEQ